MSWAVVIPLRSVHSLLEEFLLCLNICLKISYHFIIIFRMSWSNSCRVALLISVSILRIFKKIILPIEIVFHSSSSDHTSRFLCEGSMLVPTFNK